MWKTSVFLLFSITFLNCYSSTSSNYFFDKSEVAGLSEKQWLAKCVTILNETRLHQVIFNIRGLCTQLRCLRESNLNVYMGFDFCMKSATRCVYSDPDPTLPYPECCPRRQCSGLKAKILDYKTFMQKRNDQRQIKLNDRRISLRTSL